MESTARVAEIRHAVEHAAHHLPAQGPIDVFIHHNTLHAFEAEPFEEAVVRAGRLLGTEPFLPESRYRQELAQGRIRESDIDAVLAADRSCPPDATVAAGRVPLRSLYRALLLHAVREESDASVRWTLTESDVIERLRPDLPPATRQRLLAAAGADERRVSSDLWHACVEAVAIMRSAVARGATPVRHRDLILAVEPTLDTDALVHPLLIRLCAAFLDQGVASRAMPGRERGLWEAGAELYAGRLGPREPWNELLPAALRQVRGLSAEECVAGELDRLGVPSEHREEFITQSLLALRGWAGMIRQFEERPDRAPVVAVPARLIDFLALRLVCDRVATEWAVRRMGLRGPAPGAADGTLAWLWWELRDRHPPRRGVGSVCRAFRLHQVAQLVGLTGDDIRALDENELLRLEHAISAFDATTRRRLFHLAYERRHRIEILDALEAHAAVARPPAERPPAAQWVFCIDERCESFRRHVEELGAGHETFGTAGFFAVPMYYQGLDDWHAAPLCPIVMRPTRTVVEVPRDEAVARHEFRRSIRRRYGQLAGSLSAGSRTLFRGGLFTPVIGALAAIPLVARVAFPRLTARLGRTAAALAGKRIPTRLELEQSDAPGLVAGTQSGFDIDEMAGMVRRVLEDIGLTARLSRVVAVVGHGSSSRNNPHESAYDCGACGGGRGGPNARAFALMANDPRVRARLAADGLVIPPTTWFLGGMLDTCATTLTWYDADTVPLDHRAAVDAVREAAERVAAADAHERCRRFETARLDITPGAARAHVEARSVDLAQVRPELGHATNAVCIVGRRWRTRGLFLDRRAFLVSYDPTADDDGAILTRTLAAVGPVGAGINLEYYFSVIDRLGYGAGTKLPHNITGLIGVMDGHASDLRTGLPWQMVEIHEPVRLLVIIDAPPERIMAAAAKVPAVERLAVNRWIQLVAWDPVGSGLHVFTDGRFVPFEGERCIQPVVERSVDWYRGHREHLPPARILAALGGGAAGEVRA
jgi:uncharacterized protein YbcC (UPF0753/DUF2309 family)